uniref:Uncharacterized protein n=1 Tax=Felis catus TaxID=9685 RepID=A0ABI7YLQ8_FELCA
MAGDKTGPERLISWTSSIKGILVQSSKGREVCFSNYHLEESNLKVFLQEYSTGWKCKLVQPVWKTVWRFLKKLKIELPYDPAIALLGIYPRDTGVLFRRDACSPMFITAQSTIAKVWKDVN